MKARRTRLPLRRFPSLALIRIVALLLVIGSFAPNARAQRAEAIRIGLAVDRDSLVPLKLKSFSDTVAVDPTSSRPNRTARGALIGAGAGMGTGIVAAFIATHRSGVTDHSEDGFAYIAFAGIGALVGLVIGGIVGFVRD